MKNTSPWLLIVGFVVASAAIERATAEQHTPHGRPDHLNHRFDDPERYAKSFDDPARDAWQMPPRVIEALGLEADDTVADIGAGTGYFTVRIAKAVPTGRVFAVDVDPAMLAHIGKRVTAAGIDNVVTVQATSASPQLPGRADTVVVVNTYHHLPDRVSYFRELKASLTPAGRIAIIDFRKDSPDGPPPEFRFDAEQIVAEMGRAGYRLDARHDFLPRQHFLIFRAAPSAGAAAARSPSILAERVMRLTRDSPWTRIGSVRMSFNTHHPQGLVKTRDGFVISSVEVHDRGAGKGVGHIFKVTSTGDLITDLNVGDGAMYHPGGIDFDGTSVWVPVAEYRPDSRSIVYRVDPRSMKATEVLRFADHIGAIVHNTDDNTLHGVSWGSRRFYRWTLDRQGRVTNANVPPERGRTLNTSHYLDYQDCKYASRRRMLCTGVTELRRTAGEVPFRLGGIDLVDLGDGRPVHQVPVLLWTANGLDMTHNPVWLEPTATGVRGYFMPEDNESSIYIYDAETRPSPLDASP